MSRQHQATPTAVAPNDWLAGFAKAAINAPVGTPMDGPRAQGGTTGCHDDVCVRALWLEHGFERVALVAFDLLFTERPTLDRLKGAASRCLGLRAAEVLINFSHTHAPPGFSHWSYGNEPDPLYVEKVETALVEALAAARAARQPARIFAGRTVTRLPLNRRRPDASGRIGFRPNPDGEVCTALPFFLVRNRADEVLSLVFAAACHPSIWFRHETSADFPGVAVAALNRHFATGGALFLQGAGGDAKPRQIMTADMTWRQNEWADIEAAGHLLAAEVIAAAGQVREVPPALVTTLFDAEFPLCPPPDAGQIDILATDANRSRSRWAADMKRRLAFFGKLPARAPMAVHAVHLGAGLRLIGLEAEVTAPVGNQVLRAYADGVTFALGYTNGTQFYLPSDRQLAEGGYEAESCWEYHWPANLAPGVDTVVAAALARAKCEGVV